MPFGSALGPIFGSMCARYLGPKQSIITSAVPFLVSYILIVFASNASYLFASRFISGIGVGFGFSSVPIYIGEIAENHNRGALTIMMMLMLGFGSGLPICVGPFLTLQMMAIVSCIFPILLLATFVFMPESPYYLMRLGKEDEARISLQWLRRQKESEAVQGEILQIKKLVENNCSFFECFKEIKNKPNPKALFLIFSTILAQQFSGAMAVTFYQEQIYASNDIPISPYLAVIISQCLGTVFGIASIFFIDRWGRKPLLILSTSGCCLSTALIAVYYQISYIQNDYPDVKWLPVLATNSLMIFFSIGLAPIPYTILGEVFSSSFKEAATCMISVGGAIASFAVTKLFQVFHDSFGPAFVFYSLSAVSFTMLVIMIVFLPETMNRSLLDIQNLLMGGSESDLSAKITSDVKNKKVTSE